jgi:thiamine-phosphate pyrophosphorylase
VNGLYAICDLDFLAKQTLDPLRYAQALIAARPAALQIRAKHASAQVTLQLLRELKDPCASAGTLLFANDRPDLAVLAQCDGVHVGQTDLSVAQVRRFAGELQVGVSTHSQAQLEAALRERPSYVAFGPVFETSSKENPDPVRGLPAVLQAAQLARAAGIPIVAIGGITLERLPQLVRHVDAVAVISGLCPERNQLPAETAFWAAVTECARSFQAAFSDR